jgi:hypothetical protein
MKLILSLLLASACCSAFADATLILGTAPESALSAESAQRMNFAHSKPKGVRAARCCADQPGCAEFQRHRRQHQRQRAGSSAR